MNYMEALNYIESTARFGSNLGLERVEKLLELLGNPQERIKCIHVAGTNGKGSITAMISKILSTSGYRVGMYTSPHLEVFEERIQINGNNISRDDLALSVTEVSKAVDKVLELGYDNPTEFEIETCVMFHYFDRKKVDFAVVEVGLGGRLDATNAIPPFDVGTGGGTILSVIASISYDHMKILGDTLDKIAYEKAGIIKKGIPVILYPQKKIAEKVIENICFEKKCRLVKVPCNSVKLVQKGKIDKNSRNYCQDLNALMADGKVYSIKLSLLGTHQILNCVVAIFAAEELMRMGVNITMEKLVLALSEVNWIGRLEVMNNKPLVVMDGAHNIDGIEILKKSIQTYFKYENMVLILGILADKQVDDMVREIVPMAKNVLCVTPDSDRAESAEELKKVVFKYNKNCEAFEDYYSAYVKAMSCAGEDDIVVIAGSLYMIGGMRKQINTNKKI
ncbi:MAG: bifunctional folylpolyglutamate synthase/dihydrofolate synthase [Clostridium sp.]|uniref:bifunctional folylpolyglutamate synthase/dihydrofolate synthase n=1 Tax=Clostridium sp. TaxID=1506 RepID=UPI0025B97E0C|nr:folylpolyglutamate synthase/dihydrofolate synthase family protein [Clostridium sp.]MCH3962796.1 bifunctional folylpolyglutamate synthase/dihydrofolate synthase [Clostridium sp.]MCI1715789.1 bifunctional folylpolyglutamate synthase/dihydrofolate synthase [Clostridium sp.]MCI1800006.1 bifunctional folylpolyglutamate synthase/dihydrofolate synthase [Clostridium sp.]MCI1813920.1 bifunctional folylpolyglutamate synthase/dihydrofolate synthase [Clostridium sp.]MCI1870818.1 bifunctional folylpolyg